MTTEPFSSSSRSIDDLQEIIRYCHRHEQCLRDLARQTRRERKKAERLLRETSPRKRSETFLIAFDNHKAKQQARRSTPAGQRTAHRVRFHADDVQPLARTRANESDDDDLTRRCDDLLSQLQIHRHRAIALENASLVRSTASTDPPAAVTHLRHALEHLRPPSVSYCSSLSRRPIKNSVIERLKTVYDPEIPVNIFELGLVYYIIDGWYLWNVCMHLDRIESEKIATSSPRISHNVNCHQHTQKCVA